MNSRAPSVTERIPSGQHRSLSATEPVVEALVRVLADTAVLQMKTHGFHWNVRGVGFFQLHTAFETQYNELFAAIDEIAERVRALGAISPASFGEMLKLSAIQEAQNQGKLSASDMVGTLAQDHRAVEHRCREALKAAQAAGDESSADLMITRMEWHDKTAWMLDAWLQ